MATQKDGTPMRSASRLVATAVAAIVWILAGVSVASGPLGTSASIAAKLDAKASCHLCLGR
jgi:lipid-binding SYLF domain-containing protein